MFTFGVATVDELYATTTIRIATRARALFAAVTVAGAVAAILESEAGVALILVGVVGTLAAQLAVGVAGYRRAMSRPWPRVRPLDDEDDW